MPAFMNRIAQRFSGLKQARQKGFIVYIGAGDPDLETTFRLALEFDRVGVDVLELGVPFSDPLADGLVNQLAAQRGLQSGTTPAGVLELVRRIRKECSIPLVLYIYFNLLHRHGLEKFIRAAAQAGVDGLLVLDLPPEESGPYEQLMEEAGMCVIYLVAPTTPPDRIRQIVSRGSGFVYYVSREGVTGMQERISSTIAEMTAKIRAATSLPIAVGFGISNPDQARKVAVYGDAIVVGSAVVNRLAEAGKAKDGVARVGAFVESLVAAVKTHEEKI